MFYFLLQALKRDNDLYELAKKAEQETAENTEKSEITDTNTTFDVPMQPLRCVHRHIEIYQ